jgi:hypothetical protein
VTATANRLIGAAATAGLAPLGLRRKGRSRIWVDDHAWWLVNVEFQPSARGEGCSLNVGTQHLWARSGHLCLDDVERPLGGSHFVAFTGDDAAFTAAMHGVVAAAAAAVERFRQRHGEGTDALSRLVAGENDLDAGIAAALLGDTPSADRRLQGAIHPAFRALADDYASLDVDAARALATSIVTDERRALGLPALSAALPWPIDAASVVGER